jgi:integrase
MVRSAVRSKGMNKTEKPILPGLYRLGKKDWAIRVQTKDPRTGKKINRRRILKGITRSEAIREMEALRTQLAEGTTRTAPPEVTSQVTLADFAESWLRIRINRNDLAPNTLARYPVVLDHLSAWLKNMKIGDVRPLDIEQWMLASKKSYAPGTINSWLRVLRTVFTDAIKDGVVTTNPATMVKPLKVPLNLEEPNALAPEELHRLLNAMAKQGHTIAAAAWTQALTGLRWGETSALMWDDFDEAKRVLRIRRSVSRGQLRPTTKTGRARVVGVPAILVEKLKEHRRLLLAEQHKGLSSGLMFPSRAGTPLASKSITLALRRALKDAGINKRFTSHGFRRSMTDMLRLTAVDPTIATALIGHATQSMRSHYSTVREYEAVVAGDKVASLLTQESIGESIEESTLIPQ